MIELLYDRSSDEGTRQRQLYTADFAGLDVSSPEDLAKAQQVLDDADDTLGKSGR